MTDLKACPFCGGKDIQIEQTDRGGYYAWCPKCHIGTDPWSKAVLAKESWNRRDYVSESYAKGWSDAVDAMRVIRCEDCKKYRYDSIFEETLCQGHYAGHIVKPDDYCSYGERKDKDNG